MAYEFKAVEERWQRRWSAERVFEAPPDPAREKYYCLEMLPYPSGRLHVGHVRNYAIGDALAWYHRLRGRNVFHPIGWDAMGLPAENAAIKNGVPPAEWTLVNIAQMRAQLQRIGVSYDWGTEIATCDPAFYRWNQWFFLRMLERGLAYRALRTLNWCPSCATVLAEAQVTPSGCCWRHEETPVEKRDLEQWFLRITRYADRLVEGLDRLEAGWPERVIALQRHWLGRSDGCRFAFTVEGSADTIEVFTTRVDTVYGCAAVFIAAAHPLVPRLVAGDPGEAPRGAPREAPREGPYAAEVRAFVAAEAAAAATAEDLETRPKRGAFTGRYAINPFNGERVPIWVANFVLAEFGTGAVFAQPAHDQRDFEFARAHGLALRPVIRPEDGVLPDGATMDVAFTAYGVLENSGPFSGLTSAQARQEMARHAERMGFGRPEVQYRIRDWGISRQRYWGTPIPVIYCDACGIVPVPDDALPVALPEVPDWKGQTGSPLAQVASWVETTCPRCSAPARRETDTMDTFVDSSWYFLRYTDPRNPHQPFDPARAAYFMPVDMYIGGVEHATGHLIYFRFWTMFLHDLGLVSFDEPAPRLFSQGMVRARSFRCPIHDYLRLHEVHFEKGDRACCPHCGSAVEVHVDKMSKSKLNDSDLDSMVERYGADAVRMAVLFGGPPAQDFDWNDTAIEGTWRFVQRIVRLVDRFGALVRGLPAIPADVPFVEADAEALRLRRTTHRTIERVSRDIEREFQFNTAIAAQMELVNELYRQTEGHDLDAGSPRAAALAEALKTLALLLAPFAPHLAEELHERLGGRDFVARSRWPEAEPRLLVEDHVELPVQVLGKLRGQVVVPRGSGEETVLAAVRAEPALSRHLEGRQLVRVVLVPDRLVNLVLR